MTCLEHPFRCESPYQKSHFNAKSATESQSLLTCTINSLTPHLYGWPWQTEKFVRRHSVNVLRFFAETEESALSVRTKRVTMDFSLLSVPCVPESALQPTVSLQVQNESFFHTVPYRSVPSGNVRVCVLNPKPFLCQMVLRLWPVCFLLP